MVPFEMALDARLALAKMSVIYEREVGNKIRMSRDEDIVGLINFAVDSFNEEIIRYLDTFTKLLEPSELRQLVAQGANIYRGAIVPEKQDFSPEHSDKQGPEAVTIYRGVPVEGVRPGMTNLEAPDTKTDSNAAKKSRRVYRGRVIEE